MKIQSNLIGDYEPYGSEVANLAKYYEGAKISNQKIHQLWDIFPLLKDEIIGGGNFGNDYVRLTFKNGSLFDVMTPLNSTRGNRATCGILDEFRQKIKSRMLKKLNFAL